MTDNNPIVDAEYRPAEEHLPATRPATRPAEVDYEYALEVAEKKADFWGRFRKVTISVLAKNDFMDQGGKPWLTGRGAEKLATFLGLRVTDKEREPTLAEISRVIKRSEPVTVVVTAIVRSDVLNLEDIYTGTCTTSNKFYAERKQIDPGDVIKHAETNLMANAISRMMGFGNLTWAELEELGFKRDEAGGSVDYGQREKLVNDIWDICMEMCGQEKKAATDYLEKMSAFRAQDGKEVAGIRAFSNKISIKRLQVLYNKAKKDRDDHLGAKKEGDPNDDDKPF